jgi:uncharacterized protein (TIGR02246 family)
VSTVETRLRSLEDREEIRSLLVRYAERLDDADYEGYAQLFAEDGELDAPLGHARGRDAIRGLLEERLGGAARKERPTSFHLLGTPSLAVDGDRATSTVLWYYVDHDAAGMPRILQLGHYRDAFVRVDGRWLFQRRQITRDLGVSPLD